MSIMGIVFSLFILLSWGSQQHDTLLPLCDCIRTDAIEVNVVYQGGGETHLWWELKSTEALWDYDFSQSPELQRYAEWL